MNIFLDTQLTTKLRQFEVTMTQLQQRNTALVSDKAKSEKQIFALKGELDTKNVEFEEKVQLAQSQALELQRENEKLKSDLATSRSELATSKLELATSIDLSEANFKAKTESLNADLDLEKNKNQELNLALADGALEVAALNQKILELTLQIESIEQKTLEENQLRKQLLSSLFQKFVKPQEFFKPQNFLSSKTFLIPKF